MLQYRMLYLFLFLLFISVYADTVRIDSVTQSKISSPPAYSVAVFDMNLSMRSGAPTVVGIHNVLTIGEDAVIKASLFSEEKPLGKAGGVLYRLSKYTLIDLPVDAFLSVYAHEYFGHGARIREQDWLKVVYGYEIPPPYGRGGGHAIAWPHRSRIYTEDELLALSSGGMEVVSLINRNLCLRWIAKGEIHYREASLYIISFWSNFRYIVFTSDEDLEDYQDTGHDVAKYLMLINGKAGYTSINNLHMDPRGLKTRNITSLANPFLFYAFYTSLKTYFWDGNHTEKLKMMNIKGFDYMPSFRMSLTPFGPEYHLENYLRVKNKTFLLDLRFCDNMFYKFWGGIELFAQNIYEYKRVSLDANLNVWRQPEIEIGGYPMVVKGGGLGVAFSIRGYYDFKNTIYPVWAILELGYKTPGFLQGYTLDSSPIIMLGIGMRI